MGDTMLSEAGVTMTIGGEGVKGLATFPVLNPANETIVAAAPDCSREQFEEAVSAARKAFGPWSQTAFAERQRLVAAMGHALIEHVEDLKPLLTAEQGKTLEDAGWDILGGGYGCLNTAKLDIPTTQNEATPEHYSETRHVPIGVIGAIAPWNYPVALAMLKVAPAILAGNTVILKPSPFTPLTTLRIGEILRKVLPPGVLNVVSGGDRLGPWMTSHPGIDKISFTGSTQTGRKVMASAAASLKRLTLELGGNDPAIVLPDVDVAATAEALFWAAFRNSGQICVATKRIYVHADVYEPLKQAMIDYAGTVQMGDGAQQGVKLGPVQNRPQYDRVLDLISDCRRNGHSFALGGEPMPGPGYFVPVTIIDNPPENSRIVQEEQFGPVVPLMKFHDIEDAIARANATDYGLGASVWSADTDRAASIGGRMAAGVVWVNDAQYLPAHAAFSGHKQSGFGVENGLEGLLEYTNSQTLTVKRPAAAA